MGFWDAKYWLPRDVTWDALSNTTVSDGIYPQSTHLSLGLLMGVLLTIYRIVFENVIFLPIAHYRKVDHSVTRQGIFDKEKKYKRMAECAMRCIYYTCSFFGGLYVLRNQPQLYDITECWRNWPFHVVPEPVAWYYMIQGGFYLSLIVGMIFFDAVRSDFWQMMGHHIITLMLIYVSWIMNMVRVGTLILASHDAVDILIDLAKIFRYDGRDTALFYTFISVLIVWVLTRIVYYPFWVLHSVWFDAPALIQSDYSWLNATQLPLAPRAIMVLLSLLLILHVFWTYILFKVAYESAQDGVLDDVREDFDESSKIRKQAKKDD